MKVTLKELRRIIAEESDRLRQHHPDAQRWAAYDVVTDSVPREPAAVKSQSRRRIDGIDDAYDIDEMQLKLDADDE